MLYRAAGEYPKVHFFDKLPKKGTRATNLSALTTDYSQTSVSTSLQISHNLGNFSGLQVIFRKEKISSGLPSTSSSRPNLFLLTVTSNGAGSVCGDKGSDPLPFVKWPGVMLTQADRGAPLPNP